MFFISHRGNVYGKKPEYENMPSYIENAIKLGFDVEVDVWVELIDNAATIFLGHDKPQYKTTIEFLQNPKIWCHAKNLPALELLLLHDCHVFSHNTDSYTITSRGIIWAFPAQPLSNLTIAVMPKYDDYSSDQLSICKGICSDDIYDYFLKYSSKSSGVPKQ